MENLNKYINNVFAGLPDSPNKEALRDKVQRESQEKFDNLISQGNNEREALGIIVQEMDVEEIYGSLSVDYGQQEGFNQQPFQQGAPQWQQQGYGEWQQSPQLNQQTQWQEYQQWPQSQSEQQGEQQPFQQGFHPYQTVQTPRTAAQQAEIDEMVSGFRHFQPRFAIGIAFGVALCILAIVFVGLVSVAWGNQALTAAAFFVPIAIGVFLFIIFGMRYSNYMSYFRAKGMYEFLSVEEQEKMLKLEHRYRFTPSDKAYKKERRREVLSSVLWLLTIIAYLLLGFLANLWHPGWIIFLVAAAIQTVISLA